MEASFETSFLRPSHSPTSGSRNTLPLAPPVVSPSYSPVPSLTPVLSPSSSSSSGVRTPSSVESLPESSIGQPWPYQPKNLYEESINLSLPEFENDLEMQKVNPMMSPLSTESSLPSSVAPSSVRFSSFFSSVGS